MTSEALDSYSDLAAAGVNMPLTQPSEKEIRMEKKNLLKVIHRAIKASEARVIFVSTTANQFVLSPEQVLGQTQLKLRPWKTLAEKAALDLTSNQFNYLVNGAFEYTGYSWDLSAGNGAELKFTQAVNHDAQDNVMVKCHSGQGISLQCDLPAGGSAAIANRRKICTDVPAEAFFRMFVRGGDPRQLKVTLGSTQLEPVVLPPEAEDGSGFRELRFRPVRIPAGEYTFRIEFKNPAKEPVTLNLDDLVLQLKEAGK